MSISVVQFSFKNIAWVWHTETKPWADVLKKLKKMAPAAAFRRTERAVHPQCLCSGRALAFDLSPTCARSSTPHRLSSSHRPLHLSLTRRCCGSPLAKATWHRPHNIVRVAVPVVLLLIIVPIICLIESFKDRTPMLAATLLSRHGDCLVHAASPTEASHPLSHGDEEVCSQVLRDVVAFFGTSLSSVKVGDRELRGNSGSVPLSHELFVNGVTLVLRSHMPYWSLLVCQIVVAVCIWLLFLGIEWLLRRAALSEYTHMDNEIDVSEGSHRGTFGGHSRTLHTRTTTDEARSGFGPDCRSTTSLQTEALVQKGSTLNIPSRSGNGTGSGIGIVNGSGDTTQRSSHRIPSFQGGLSAGKIFGGNSYETERSCLHTVTAIEGLIGAAEGIRKQKEKNHTFFFNAVSHELRTPIAVMLGNAEVLQGTLTAPAQLALVKEIHTAGAAVMQGVQDIVEYGSTLEGEVGVERLPFSVVASVGQIVKEYQDKYSQEFKFICGVRLAQLLIGDPEKVSCILRKVLNNAVEHTKSGGTISVRIFTPSAQDASDLCGVLRSTPDMRSLQNQVVTLPHWGFG